MVIYHVRLGPGKFADNGCANRDISKDEWNTKENTGLVHKECIVPKGTSRAEAASNSEKIKVRALAFIELYLTEGIYQSGSQSVRQKKILLNKKN